MSKYFFDVHDSIVTIDQEGVDLPNHASVRKAAMDLLPAVAADEIPVDGDRRHFTVLVTDDEGKPIYSATLTYTGLWLLR